MRHAVKRFDIRAVKVRRHPADFSAVQVICMNKSALSDVEKHCPSACVVYDLFHVIAKDSREFVDHVRDPSERPATSQRHTKALQGLEVSAAAFAARH